MTKNIEQWIDEDGKEVDICNFNFKFYVDEISKYLYEKYDVNSYTGCNHSTLGKSQYESDASTILLLCKFLESVIGLTKEDWDNYYNVANPRDHSRSEMYILNLDSFKKYFRVKKVMGKQVYFPSEELLINQRIKLK